MNETRVVISTDKYCNKLVTLDMPYEMVCEEMDDAIIDVVESYLGDDVGDREKLKVTKQSITRTVYIMLKPVYGASGAARQIQSKYGLPDKVTEDIAKTLQAFYETGVEMEKQRQIESEEEERQDAICQCRKPLLYWKGAEELWCRRCNRLNDVELEE